MYAKCHVFYDNVYVCQLESFVRVYKWCFMCGEDTLLLISELHRWGNESVHFKFCGTFSTKLVTK
jgi:hypothetical protein